MNKYLKFLILIIAAGAVLLLYFLVEPKDGNLPKCLFHELTGLYCPGCGVQRSFHSLLHGHLLLAMSYNVLFILLLPLIIFFVINFFLGRKYSSASFIYKPVFSFAIVCIIIGFWILRNVPVPPFSWLAP